MPTEVKHYIVSTPGTCGGKPRIDGHRIRVQDIAHWHEVEGMSADEIVSDFPGLTLAKVYAALSYYFDHLDEIQAGVEEERRFVEECMKNHASPLKTSLGGAGD